MNAVTRKVDLGFAEARVPAGTHMCQIYTDGSERMDALLRFVTRGLKNGESTACFSENVDGGELDAWFAAEGLSLDEEKRSGRFALSGTTEVYFEGNRFDPDRMLALLAAFHDGSVKAGRSGARVIGEMLPGISLVEGGSRLMEYESRVNNLLHTHPVTAVCQYDARAFDGATIMDVLAVHPMMFVHGSVIHNPFFVDPAACAAP